MVYSCISGYGVSTLNGVSVICVLIWSQRFVQCNRPVILVAGIVSALCVC
jgi:hypothetical protein